MNKTSIWLTAVLTAASLTGAASATDLTAVTLFGCNDQGVVDTAFRTNSGPMDGAWDVFLYEGAVFDPASDTPDKIPWLNDRENHFEGGEAPERRRNAAVGMYPKRRRER